MSGLVPRHRYTFEEYLELEEIASVRHEFYDGEIYAMAGGTPEHAAITAAITSALGAQIEGSDCRVYSSDLRVRVLATGLATYPDVTIVCGPSERPDHLAPGLSTDPRPAVYGVNLAHRSRADAARLDGCGRGQSHTHHPPPQRERHDPVGREGCSGRTQ